MENVWVRNIKVSNPLIASYIKRIKTWDEEDKFKIKEDEEAFYAIYLDDQFLAASTMDYEPETLNVNILLINGSNQNYDRIQKESIKQLTSIAIENYDAKTAIINNGKKLVLTK